MIRGKEPPRLHWIGGWVRPKAALEAVAKRKKSHIAPCRESNSGRPYRSLVSILTELPRLLNSDICYVLEYL